MAAAFDPGATLLGYFVRDSSRPPLFFVIQFDYFLMANAIAKTAIALYSPVNIMQGKKMHRGAPVVR